MRGKRILVVVAENADAIPRKQEFSGAWVDECWPVGIVEDKRKTYGPPKKGTGGKVRRW